VVDVGGAVEKFVGKIEGVVSKCQDESKGIKHSVKIGVKK
jgi:hypothetical protein